jgi:hypothetical protein
LSAESVNEESCTVWRSDDEVEGEQDGEELDAFSAEEVEAWVVG